MQVASVSPLITSLNSIDIAIEIIRYIHINALLPIALTCKRLLDGVIKLLRTMNVALTSNGKYFISTTNTAQWAISLGCNVTIMMKHALKEGKLDLIKWLKLHFDNVIQLTTNDISNAALNNYFDVLKWLRLENDPPCPWNEQCCEYAAKGGHLDVLKWLRLEN